VDLTRRSATWRREARPEEHMQRVRKQGDLRPMKGNPKAMEELRSILTSRESLYAQAEAVVDTSGRTLKQSTKDLVDVVRKLDVI
jgi:XRE family transcriptional regulator, aerobic/anaerobic benzoate catabolism transcriptional regulator